MNEPVTVFIICITGFISWKAFSNLNILEQYMFTPTRILRNKEYHRLMTSALIHGSWIHLLFNMFSFYSFGGLIEQAYSPYVLLFIYLSSILGGSLLSLVLHRNNVAYRALGASGGVCGVIFASIFLVPGGSVYIFPIPVPIPSWLFAILFILFSFYGMRKQLGNIGHDAHLGGALTGLAVATVMYPSIVSKSPMLYAFIVIFSLTMLVIGQKSGSAYARGGRTDLKRWFKETIERLTGKRR
jgi:membrane associated rhomboid family serine protease